MVTSVCILKWLFLAHWDAPYRMPLARILQMQTSSHRTPTMQNRLSASSLPGSKGYDGLPVFITVAVCPLHFCWDLYSERDHSLVTIKSGAPY